MSHVHTDSVAGKYGMGRKTLKSYLIGLGLSLAFTLLAFMLVTRHNFSDMFIYISLAVLAVLQLLAQVICFLRLNVSEEGRWNVMPFIFTIVVVGVLVAGSLWIMINLNYNMMH